MKNDGPGVFRSLNSDHTMKTHAETSSRSRGFPDMMRAMGRVDMVGCCKRRKRQYMFQSAADEATMCASARLVFPVTLFSSANSYAGTFSTAEHQNFVEACSTPRVGSAREIDFISVAACSMGAALLLASSIGPARRCCVLFQGPNCAWWRTPSEPRHRQLAHKSPPRWRATMPDDPRRGRQCWMYWRE